MANGGLRERRSLTDLQADYDSNKDKKPLENLWRAWKGIKELPPDDPNSFFMIGGYHGEPFRGAGWGNSAWWGGYCNHGNVLFPTWHRLYLLRLEDALRSIPDCKDVTLPFWDETSADSAASGIPHALTDETVKLGDEIIPNPLKSFAFPKAILDNIHGDNPNYSKPLPYVTERYPRSGLVGTDQDRAATKTHNDQYSDPATNVRLLNKNIVTWLTTTVDINGRTVTPNVRSQYEACLEAPNYTVFSNTTSAHQWRDDHPHDVPVVALEAPHNMIHLAVGGYDVSSGPNAEDDDFIEGANGDMGENDTAALDPIFFFHHCHVDRMFWLWQQKHGCTDHLEIFEGYPGTNSVDAQGPTPGVAGGTWLGMDSPLAPFKKQDGSTYTSRDCVNSERQLGVTYGPGSMQDAGVLKAAAAAKPPIAKVLAVSGINRGAIAGSFLVNAYVNHDGKRWRIGTEAVLSRWGIAGCANCQAHLEVKAHFPVPKAIDDLSPTYEIELHTHKGRSREPHLLAADGSHRRVYRLEVREVRPAPMAAE